MRTTHFSSVPYKFLAALAVIAMVLAALPVMPAYAASITVNTTVDELTTNGLCSLREALLNANNNASAGHPDCLGGSGADTIILTGGAVYTLSLVATDNTGGDLDVTDAAGLIIQTNNGTAATIDAADIDRVFDVANGAGNLTLTNLIITNGTASSPLTGGGISVAGTSTLTLTNSTVSNNVATSLSGCGAGIYNNSAAAIVINNSTISGNLCSQPGADGGGLFKGTGGTLTITNSTFSGNSTNDDGGALELAAGTVTITNSTFSGNTAGNRGGAVHVGGAAVTVEFSTFSANTANAVGNNGGGAIQASAGSAAVNRSILANSTAGMDCHKSLTGTVTLTDALVEQTTTCTGTFITSDPGLGGLASNGGPTQTMSITSSSPAFNAADTCNGITTDQRGFVRPSGASCDLGAFEVDAAPTVVSIVAASPNPTSAATVNYTVTFSEDVSGVGSSDFSLDTTGDLQDATVGAITPVSGSVYTVTVNTGTGSGTLRLDVPDTATIKDAGNNNLTGLPFTAGDVYTKFQDKPAMATPNSPTGTTLDDTPTFSWSEVFDTTWYYLWVSRVNSDGTVTPVIKTWYEVGNSALVCSSNVCSITPGVSLPAGNYRWWVQTWNPAGYGPWSNPPVNFTVAAPGAATPTSPTGNIGTDYNPTYTWNKVNGATWYYLWVNAPSGAGYIKKWYEASAVCGASTCSTKGPKTLAGGTHTWWIQTWSPAGYGAWSSPAVTFTTAARSAPGQATLVSPSGAITDTTPTYTWNKVADAEWYYLWVDGPSGNVIKQWYESSAVCGASTCSVTPAVTLGSGQHKWWIQTWNAAGYGPWSAPAVTFTLP